MHHHMHDSKRQRNVATYDFKGSHGCKRIKGKSVLKCNKVRPLTNWPSNRSNETIMSQQVRIKSVAFDTIPVGIVLMLAVRARSEASGNYDDSLIDCAKCFRE